MHKPTGHPGKHFHFCVEVTDADGWLTVLCLAIAKRAGTNLVSASIAKATVKHAANDEQQTTKLNQFYIEVKQIVLTTV